MKFKSTRGGVAGVSFEEAVLSGCAGDGGLFMPERIPSISKEQLKAWSALSYPQLVEKLLRVFVDPVEMSEQELKSEQHIRPFTSLGRGSKKKKLPVLA